MNYPLYGGIVKIDNDPQRVLSTACEEVKVTAEGLAEAKEITKELVKALPSSMAAGLAAPQIGISKSIFIFSWDRTEKNRQAVINPTYTPVGDEAEEKWEGCFSVILTQRPPYKLAKIRRYKSIHASFLNLEGQRVELILKGFGAHVFQHECDHLMGKVNICYEEIEIKSFQNHEDLTVFFDDIKKNDSVGYIAPTVISAG